VSLSDSLRARAAGTALLLMDVDGVMTDGKLYHLPREDGQVIEIKGFDSQDGISLQWLQWKGIRTGLISGRVSVGAAERAKQLKMNYVYQGHIEKIPILDEILVDAKLRPEEVAYIGDDLTDIVVMNRVGFAIAVANARPEVKGAAHYVTTARGGSGAVREVAEIILEARGCWGEILEKYEVRQR
jgi:3-deoxy-D-manno-octulosonate 8-phosphate phosphatase (KDO 8-P phosphatase)